MPVPPVYDNVIPDPSALDVGDATVPNDGVALTNVNVTVDDAERKFVSPDFEMDNEHTPVLRAVTRPAVSEQLAVPCVTEVETEPVPPPPVTATMMPDNKSPVDVDTASGVWLMRSIVIVVADDERESNTLSASRVATTLQEPADVNVNCVPFTTHDAEPSSETANDTEPEPEPPVVVN